MPRRGLPGRSSASWWQTRPDKSRPPCPAQWPRGSPLARRSLRDESPLAAYHLRWFHEALAQRVSVLGAHQGLVVGAVAVYEFAHDDFAGHSQADFTGRGSVPDFAFLFVILHGVEAIAQLVAALIKGGARRDHFDEREAFFLERFADGARQLTHMEGGPARDVNCSGCFDQVRQVE